MYIHCISELERKLKLQEFNYKLESFYWRLRSFTAFNRIFENSTMENGKFSYNFKL